MILVPEIGDTFRMVLLRHYKYAGYDKAFLVAIQINSIYSKEYVMGPSAREGEL